jgi:hypothetical protein
LEIVHCLANAVDMENAFVINANVNPVTLFLTVLKKFAQITVTTEELVWTVHVYVMLDTP